MNYKIVRGSRGYVGEQHSIWVLADGADNGTGKSEAQHCLHVLSGNIGGGEIELCSKAFCQHCQ